MDDCDKEKCNTSNTTLLTQLCNLTKFFGRKRQSNYLDTEYHKCSSKKQSEFHKQRTNTFVTKENSKVFMLSSKISDKNLIEKNNLKQKSFEKNEKHIVNSQMTNKSLSKKHNTNIKCHTTVPANLFVKSSLSNTNKIFNQTDDDSSIDSPEAKNKNEVYFDLYNSNLRAVADLSHRTNSIRWQSNNNHCSGSKNIFVNFSKHNSSPSTKFSEKILYEDKNLDHKYICAKLSNNRKSIDLTVEPCGNDKFKEGKLHAIGYATTAGSITDFEQQCQQHQIERSCTNNNNLSLNRCNDRVKGDSFTKYHYVADTGQFSMDNSMSNNQQVIATSHQTDDCVKLISNQNLTVKKQSFNIKNNLVAIDNQNNCDVVNSSCNVADSVIGKDRKIYVSTVKSQSNKLTSVKFQVYNNILQFGKIRLMLTKKLSAGTKCQFDVWEGKLLEDIWSSQDLNCNEDCFGYFNLKKCELNHLNKHNEFFKKTIQQKSPYLREGDVIAIKLFTSDEMNSDMISKSKIAYNNQSITSEAKLLRQIGKELFDYKRQTMKNLTVSFGFDIPSSIDEQEWIKLTEDDSYMSQSLRNYSEYIDKLISPEARLACSRKLPVPKFYWKATGKYINSDKLATAVAMESIKGRPMSQVLNMLKIPMKSSTAFLSIEIALKVVEAQRTISEGLSNRIINWDTKPGNIMLEMTRSKKSNRMHCTRAVIIDIGDALPGAEYTFPTYQKAGCQTKRYIVCTKGYCAPECAILIFLLASSPKACQFREIWYGTSANSFDNIEVMTRVRKRRIEQTWKEWIKQGSLSMVNITKKKNNRKEDKIKLYKSVSNCSESCFNNIGTLSTTCVTPIEIDSKLKNSRNFDINMKTLNNTENVKFFSKKALQNIVNDNINHNENLDKISANWKHVHWEIKFSQATVVFSTGLLLAQLFGGKSILHLVNRDEYKAIDCMCEWSTARINESELMCSDGENFVTNMTCFTDVSSMCSEKYNYIRNLGPDDLLPKSGIFSNEPWLSRIRQILQGCLQFLPNDRWTFSKLEEHLKLLMYDFQTATKNKYTNAIEPRFFDKKITSNKLSNNSQHNLYANCGFNTQAKIACNLLPQQQLLHTLSQGKFVKSSNNDGIDNKLYRQLIRYDVGLNSNNNHIHSRNLEFKVRGCNPTSEGFKHEAHYDGFCSNSHFNHNFGKISKESKWASSWKCKKQMVSNINRSKNAFNKKQAEYLTNPKLSHVDYNDMSNIVNLNYPSTMNEEKHKKIQCFYDVNSRYQQNTHYLNSLIPKYYPIDGYSN